MSRSFVVYSKIFSGCISQAYLLQNGAYKNEGANLINCGLFSGISPLGYNIGP